MKKVAIIYNYIAHYRIPIFNLLSKDKNVDYTIYAGTKTDIAIRTAPEILEKTPPEIGGLKWKKITNVWFLKYFLWQKGILRLSISKEINTLIFLGNMYYFSTWLAAFVGRLSGKKIIFWTHGYIRNEKNIQGVIRSLFYRLAHEYLVYGNRARDILISKGFNEKRIHLIYNSLDYDEQVRIRKHSQRLNKLDLFKNPDLPIAGFIGRLTSQKKIEVLIESFARLIKQGNLANLLIIGDGQKRNELQERVRKHEITDYVLFYGECFDEKKIYQLMNLMNVVVSPGEVGLTAIHSLTYGIPVLTHNKFDKQMPEYEVIKAGETGDFFEFDSPIESLTPLLKKWMFEIKKNDIKPNCFEIIEKYYNPHVQKNIFNTVV